MAQSQAKKQRQKLIREGKRSPELSRSPFAFQDLRTRKTKTKQEQLHRQKYKNHASIYGDDGSFYFQSSVSLLFARVTKISYGLLSSDVRVWWFLRKAVTHF